MPLGYMGPGAICWVLGSRAEILQEGFGDVDSSKRFWVINLVETEEMLLASCLCIHSSPNPDRVIESSSQECKGENPAQGRLSCRRVGSTGAQATGFSTYIFPEEQHGKA